MSTCIRQTAAGNTKFTFTPTFIFCSLAYPKWLWCSFFVKMCFSRNDFLVRPLKYAKFHREYYPSCVPNVTNLLNLRYFCQHNPLFYHLHLIPCGYWSWQKNVYVLVNIFVWHTFSMSKSSIKTKTILTMTDMTESTELPAFKRQNYGYKVTLKTSLCICVVLSWNELKVRQNLLASDYEIYMACLLVATVYWHKSPQFVKKSNTTLLPCLFMILYAVSMITLCSTIYSSQIWVPVYLSSPPYYVSCMTSVTHKFNNDESTSEIPRDGFFFPLCMIS